VAGDLLTDAELELLATARRAVLATIDPRGRPRLVPICFVVGGEAPLHLYSPIDEKPKASADPRILARVRDVLARPEVGILVDRWDEDWTQLGWLRLDARAQLVEPGTTPEHDQAVARLRRKYPQYEAHDLEGRPLLRLTVERVRSWSAREVSPSTP
jgi:PPOX class probable F420-dependent enzyme